MSGLLLGSVLSVCTCCFHNMVTLPSRIVATDSNTCSYHCSLSNCTHISVHESKCRWGHTILCLSIYCSFASIKHAGIKCSSVSPNFCFLFHDILFLMPDQMLLLLSPVSRLRRVSTLIFLRQTMSLGNTVLQLLWCNYSWCVYR
jgi:hypothetical protein